MTLAFSTARRFSRLLVPALALGCALLAHPAAAQVEIAPLAAPDAFTTPGRDTGLGADLWKDAPVDTARAVLPLLSSRPLSPAAAALARRVLATGARGPEGSLNDETLAAARADALVALGDPVAAARILERAPGLERSAPLSRTAAELALLQGDAARACTLAQGLSVGRGDVYWLRLRAFCQAEAGQTDAARLTFDLAQSQQADAVFARLMTARLGAGAPGAAAARNGLDLALSRSLKLDVAAAKPSPAVAAALAGSEPQPPVFAPPAFDTDIGGLGATLMIGSPPAGAVSALIAAAAEADAKGRARLQAAALLAAALTPESAAQDRARLSGFSVAEGKAPVGRNLEMDTAGRAGRIGETALLALWTAAEAGAAGPALGDRVRIVRALSAAGLAAEARAFALEGLAALK